MHSLQTIILNNQEAIDKHLTEAEVANAAKVSPSTVAQDKALNELRDQD